MGSSNYEYDHQWKKILPIGFHFVPTDEELNMYLKLKGSNGYIPPGIFSDLDIYQYEPHQLSGFAEKQWDGRMYFFTPLKKKFGNGNKIERNIDSRKGYWKSTQARKELINNNNIIGTKTSLAYYESSPNSPNYKKTSWLMLEYRFPSKLNSLPLLIDGSEYELTLCVVYYHSRKNDSTKKNDNDQIIHISIESDDISIPVQSPIDQFFSYTSWSDEHYLLQQHQPLINSRDVASTSTMQPSFSHQLPYGVMDNFDNFSSIPQNHDFHVFPYLSYENFTYIGDDKISDISNSNVDSIDQNKLEICVTPVSQDDQRPSTDSQDYDDQQPKMKKIKK